MKHAEQVKIAEQKRVEQAKVAAAQQKARQEEAARRAVLEKETAYTQRFNKHLQERHLDHSTHWLNDYSDEALAAKIVVDYHKHRHHLKIRRCIDVGR